MEMQMGSVISLSSLTDAVLPSVHRHAGGGSAASGGRHTGIGATVASSGLYRTSSNSSWELPPTVPTSVDGSPSSELSYHHGLSSLDEMTPLQRASPTHQSLSPVAEAARRSHRSSFAMSEGSAGGHVRTGKQRNVRQTTLEIADVTVQAITRHPGNFSDFLVRYWTKERRKTAGERKEAVDTLRMLMSADNDGKQDGFFSFALTLLRREQLTCALMEGITKESKVRHMFAPTGPAALKSWGRKIIANKKEFIGLQSEVAAWKFRWKLLRTAAPSVPESIWSKKDRLEKFWSEFHDRARVLENGPAGKRSPAAKFNLPMSALPLSRPGSRSDSRPASRGGISRPPSRGVAISSTPSSPTRRQQPWGAPQPRPLADAWTEAAPFASAMSMAATTTMAQAAAAEEVADSFGMRWDFERSVQWKSIETKRGTSTQRMERMLAKKSLGLSVDLSKSLNKSGSLPALERMDRRVSIAASVDSCQTCLPGGSPTNRQSHAALPPLLGSPTGAGRLLWKECDTMQIAPMPIPFLTGHSERLDAKNKALTDADLWALAAQVQESSVVKEVNLYDNMLITDKSMTQMMKHLSVRPLQDTLLVLNLGRCTRLGSYTLDAIVKLLQSGGSLQELVLCQVPISTRFQLPLCEAIGRHPSITTVNLAEIGMQPHDMTIQCLSALLSNKHLSDLDISWNIFDGKVFQSLGAFVIASSSLRRLTVANCAATLDTWGKVKLNCPVSADEFVPPLSRFLEMLSRDKSLQYLDISMDRCDQRTALILEDALDTHPNLKELVIAHNPLGIRGIRSILRLLCRDYTALMHIDLEGSFSGHNDEEDGALHGQVFSYTNPGGRYELQLWKPYHRSLLRMLYKTAEVLDLSPDEAFRPPDEGSKSMDYKISSRNSTWAHPSADEIGLRKVPEIGDLRFVFDMQNGISKKFMQGREGGNHIDEHDYGGFLRAFYSTMRFKPGYKKVIPLCAKWAELSNDTGNQQVLLSAMSRDFNMSLPILEYLVHSSRGMQRETIGALLPSLGPDSSAHFFLGLSSPTLFDYIHNQVKARNLLEFNLDNPTGHYKLDLANSTDAAVAERLLLLDRWEGALDDKHNRVDISHRGNRSHIRNEVWCGRGLEGMVRSVAEWKMPEHGEFELDYISNQRPPRKAKVLSTNLWEQVLKICHEAPCSPEDKIRALRSISHLFHLSSSHMRALIGYFKEEGQRADVFIIFYLRIVDMHNAKMFRVRFESREEVVRLQNRLGYASFFPFLQPENSRFELDLSVFDQRLCASMYVYLCSKEKFPQNLHDYGYRLPDGTKDPMPLGIPRSWGDFNAIPKQGYFRATYRCAPEDRDFSVRKEMAIQYGFFDVETLREDEVAWWTGLMEPPEDVLGLLEFFINSNYDIERAFIEIDGVDGNGCITLRELTDGLEAMNCHKFDTKKTAKGVVTKEARIDAIFRYLDPGGEGSVSRQEWSILDQLWKEFDLSIKEFVHFLTLSFGDDLADAWKALDDDGNGELNEEEWLEAVVSVGYFGPARVVFALLDRSDDGLISQAEFQVLESYKSVEDHSDTNSEVIHEP